MPTRSRIGARTLVAAVVATACFAATTGVAAPAGSPGSWAVVASPNPFGSTLGLDDVACPSAAMCFAVGGSDSGALIESWDTTSWSLDSSPSPTTGAYLSGVACSSASSCFAVG